MITSIRKHAEQIIRESEERYYLLQTSLDRFSHDLFGDMKVSEVERRLIKEVREVTKAEKVSIMEVDRNNNVVITNGNDSITGKLKQDIIELNPKDLPLCEIIEMPDAYLVKIGETVITALPADFPYPVLVVQHMPPSLRNLWHKDWIVWPVSG